MEILYGLNLIVGIERHVGESELKHILTGDAANKKMVKVIMKNMVFSSMDVTENLMQFNIYRSFLPYIHCITLSNLFTLLLNSP